MFGPMDLSRSGAKVSAAARRAPRALLRRPRSAPRGGRGRRLQICPTQSPGALKGRAAAVADAARQNRADLSIPFIKI